MKTYAIVKNGVVENITTWDGNNPFPLEPGQELREAEAARIGEPWDDSMIVLPPEPEVDPNAPVPVPPIVMTPLQFIDRFTEAEQLAIVTATMTVPAVKLWYDKLLAAQEVVFADPRLSAGMDGLVAAGLITAERKVEILDGQQTSGVTVL